MIGAIVDHNRLKGISYDRAAQKGIATAKLPIDFDKSEFRNTSLNINHGIPEMLFNVLG